MGQILRLPEVVSVELTVVARQVAAAWAQDAELSRDGVRLAQERSASMARRASVDLGVRNQVGMEQLEGQIYAEVIRLAETLRAELQPVALSDNEHAAPLSRGAQLRAKYAGRLEERKRPGGEQDETSRAAPVIGDIPADPGKYLLDKVQNPKQGSFSREDALSLATCVVDVLSEQWIARGGRSLPQRIRVIAGSIATATSARSDLAEWDFLDDAGLPVRPNRSVVRSALLDAILLGSETAVRGQVTYDTLGWDDLAASELLDAVADRYVALRKLATQAREALACAAEGLQSWQRDHPAPVPQPYGVSPAGAEAWIRDWITYMGARDAEVTRGSGDGGVDVVATGLVAQVKLYASAASIAEIRELVGAAAAFDSAPRMLFFCSGGFPAQAADFADRVGMALFTFSVETADVRASNSAAEAIMEFGLLPD